MYEHREAVRFGFSECNASEEDRRDVEDYCPNLPEEQRQYVREYHRAVTCQMLTSLWAAVVLVAASILGSGGVHGRLSRDCSENKSVQHDGSFPKCELPEFGLKGPWVWAISNPAQQACECACLAASIRPEH
jgi:hypothetical protein